jgi:hypothetical protein
MGADRRDVGPYSEAELTRLVAAHAEEQATASLRQFDAERRPRGRAVEGVAETLAALTEGRAETLIIVDDPGDVREAWFGPDLLCVHDPTRTAGPVTNLRPGRLVDIAVRAALLTDAHICVIDPDAKTGPVEGVGAVCRFA